MNYPEFQFTYFIIHPSSFLGAHLTMNSFFFNPLLWKETKENWWKKRGKYCGQYGQFSPPFLLIKLYFKATLAREEGRKYALEGRNVKKTKLSLRNYSVAEKDFNFFTIWDSFFPFEIKKKKKRKKTWLSSVGEGVSGRQIQCGTNVHVLSVTDFSQWTHILFLLISPCYFFFKILNIHEMHV